MGFRYFKVVETGEGKVEYPGKSFEQLYRFFGLFIRRSHAYKTFTEISKILQAAFLCKPAFEGDMNAAEIFKILLQLIIFHINYQGFLLLLPAHKHFFKGQIAVQVVFIRHAYLAAVFICNPKLSIPIIIGYNADV